MSTATIRELRTSFPKIRTRIEREGEVIITSLEQAFEALMGRAGTHITMQTPKP